MDFLEVETAEKNIGVPARVAHLKLMKEGLVTAITGLIGIYAYNTGLDIVSPLIYILIAVIGTLIFTAGLAMKIQAKISDLF